MDTKAHFNFKWQNIMQLVKHTGIVPIQVRKILRTCRDIVQIHVEGNVLKVNDLHATHFTLYKAPVFLLAWFHCYK